MPAETLKPRIKEVISTILETKNLLHTNQDRFGTTTSSTTAPGLVDKLNELIKKLENFTTIDTNIDEADANNVKTLANDITKNHLPKALRAAKKSATKAASTEQAVKVIEALPKAREQLTQTKGMEDSLQSIEEILKSIIPALMDELITPLTPPQIHNTTTNQ